MSRLLLLLLLLATACTSEPQTLSERDAGPNDATAAPDATEPDATEPDATEPDATEPDATEPVDAAGFPTELTLGAPERPALMKIPSGYDGEPLPIIVLLHGYSVDAATQDLYFGLSVRVDARRFFLILPDGTREASGAMYRFWNATDACCNFYGSTIDDVGYILGLIDEAAASVTIGRVYLVGHSNGGFMSHRLACDAADRIDAIVSLAGATFFDEADCSATRPINVLQIHGTADTTILYDGVATGPMRYPGAEETVLRWATRAGCELGMTETSTSINLDATLAGNETEVERYHRGCASSLDIEHWRIRGGGHIPNLVPGFGDLVLDWLIAH